MANLTKANETATALGLSQSKLYRAAQQGRIPHYRLDGALRFDIGELRGWLHRQPKRDGAESVTV